MAVGLALSTLGAADPGTTRQSPPWAVLEAASVAPGECPTQVVRITLASERVSFCAPTSLFFNVVEDGISDAAVNYAGLNQMDGYGIVNIKATAPGSTPGTGRPVYTAGGAAAYRQTVWNLETARMDRSVSDGPAGLFWNETVTGIQEDLSLPTSTGNLQIRSIEWYVERNNRLWSFILSWDTQMQNAGEWEAAAQNFSVQESDGGNLADTAIDLGKMFLESQAAGGISIMGAPIDVGAPSWWSGVCDDNNYFPHTGKHSTLLYTWHGVSACGPVGGPDYAVLFPGAAWGEYEFECVELVMRFLYLEWLIMLWPGNANQIKNSPPSSIIFYPNDGSHGIVPGDIITENASTQNAYGHTVVVTDIGGLDGTGTGSISIMEQNASSGGRRSLSVQNWQVLPDAFIWGQTIQGWLHVKGNQEDGNPDPAFTPGTGPDGRVNAIALKPSGKIFIAGDFTKYNGNSVNRIARLNSGGTRDTNYSPGTGVAMTGDTPYVNALALYSDGRVLIGGHFDSYNGTARNYIARLNSNGSLDTTFDSKTEITADIFKIVIKNPDDSASKILVGGAGTLQRLKSDGSLDTAFTGTTNNSVNDIVVQSTDGKIIIGGNFSKVDGTDRAGIARLNSNGSLDASFNPGTGTGGNAVKSISLDPDGKILIGGTFITYDGASRNRLARLNSDGSLDTTFNPGTGISGIPEYIQVVLAQTDGKILIGGNFNSYNGAALNFIGRLNYDGSLDTSFPASLDGRVQTLVVQPDGKILIGGDFTNRIARLLNHVEACYTLTKQIIPESGGSLRVAPAPNCPGSKYLSGTLVQVTAVLNPDFWLVNWSGDASGSANPLGVTMNANKSVTANLMASPGHFNKTSPENGSMDMPATLTLNWGTSDGAASYEYCLDRISNNTCDTGWVSTGTSTSASLSNLLPSVTYYWQVHARNLVDTTDGGPWWSFTRNGIPAVPVTLSPGEAIRDTQPAYVWNVSNGATSYQVIVYSISTSSTLIDDTVSSSVCSGGICTYRPSVELPLGSYEFKVAATEAGTSDFSPWRTFSVGVGVFLPLIASPGK